MARDDIYDFAGSYFAVGLTTIVGLTISAGLNATVVKLISGGSLIMTGFSQSIGVSGVGYLFNTGEAFSFNRSCTVNLLAVGSTALVSVGDGKTLTVT